MKHHGFIGSWLAMALVLVATPAAAQDGVEPEASAALDRMGAALRALPGFSGHADVTTEKVLDSGQKIQHGGTLDFQVRRPDGIKIVATSDRQARQIYYDGTSMTIFAPRMGFYGSFAAPSTIGLVIDLASTKYGIEIPLADLFLFGVDQTMTMRIKSGFVVGTETINGALCEHYAFRQELVDWQLWIRRDQTALPCKLIVTSTDDPSMPQYSATLSWDTTTVPPAEAFAFVPPEGALKISFADVSKQGQ